MTIKIRGFRGALWMHELSLCQNMIKIVNQQAEQLNCKKVSRIFLEVGQLAGIDKAALHFAFNAVTMDGVARGAVLEIIEVAGQAICNSCKKTVPVKNYYDGCETCNHFSLQIIAGEELRVQSIEVE